jgi:hypothetical protein
MTTDTSEMKDDPRGPEDQHAAGLYAAIAARLAYRSRGFRCSATFYGAEFPEHAAMPDQREAAEQYNQAVDEWVFEPPRSATATKALIEFAASISADKLLAEIANEGGPVSPEIDELHQLVALNAAAGWLTAIANREYVDRERQEDAARLRMPVKQRPDGSVEIEQPDGTRGVYRREGGVS